MARASTGPGGSPASKGHIWTLLGVIVLAGISFALGYFHAHGKLADQGLRSVAPKGTVGSLREVEFVKLGPEADLHGDYVMQQVMLSRGQVPHITGFSRAVLKPKQMLQRHAHRRLHEVYYVEKGHGVFIIDDMPTIISAGHYVHVAPGEPHSILNHTGLKDDHPDEDLILVYFGVKPALGAGTITA